VGLVGLVLGLCLSGLEVLGTVGVHQKCVATTFM